MNTERSPYTLCGCLYADTEEEAQALHKVVTALGGNGFMIRHITVNEDGSRTERDVIAQ